MEETNQPPDDQGDDQPEFDKKKLYELWANSDQEGREMLAGLFQLAGLPIPFTLPEPPEPMTAALAIPALRKLMKQSQSLARENMRVSLGVMKLSEPLGNRMVGAAILAQIQFQEVIKEIISALEKQP